MSTLINKYMPFIRTRTWDRWAPRELERPVGGLLSPNRVSGRKIGKRSFRAHLRLNGVKFRALVGKRGKLGGGKGRLWGTYGGFWGVKRV